MYELIRENLETGQKIEIFVTEDISRAFEVLSSMQFINNDPNILYYFEEKPKN